MSDKRSSPNKVAIVTGLRSRHARYGILDKRYGFARAVLTYKAEYKAMLGDCTRRGPAAEGAAASEGLDVCAVHSPTI
jgi:hypothetical protein